MPNLIDQMNILKNLPDQSLAGELSNPSGAVPPYLVLSEVNRRKDMRQRYAGQLAQQAPKTTVVQDQLAALAPPAQGVAAGPGAPMAAPGGGFPPAMPPGAPAAPQGIGAAPGYRYGGTVGYADGGYVVSPDQSVGDAVPNINAQLATLYGAPTDTSSAPSPSDQGGGIGSALLQTTPSAAVVPSADAAPMDLGIGGAAASGTAPAVALPAGPDYSGIAAGYQKQLTQEQRARDQAPWLGLMQAGLAIAGGTSPYALENIGKGGAQGLADYGAYMKDANTGTTDALRGLATTQAQQQAETAQRMSMQLEQQKFAASQDPNSPQNTPPQIRAANIYNNMPENTPEEIAAKQAMLKIIQPFAAQQAATKASYAETIADGVHDGSVGPGLQGMYSMKPAVIAALKTKYPGDNLVQMQQQEAAANRNIQSMNGPQQLRLRQSIGELVGQNGQPGMLDKLQQVANDWNGSGLPALNGANLIAAKNGAFGEAGIEKATQFQAELADVTPAMASVFSSGNSATDKALANAQDIFMKDTSAGAFDKLISLTRQNLAYRKNALDQAPAGASDNRYNFAGTASTATPPNAAVTPGLDGTIDLGNGVTMRQVSP